MTEKKSLPFGFNIVGMASANIGLGLTTRNLADILHARGFPVCIIDVEAGHNRSGKNHDLKELYLPPDASPPYAINILVEGAHCLAEFALKPSKLVTEGRLNVGFIWWEMPALPEHLRLGIEFFDVLLAGSEFIQAIMANQVARTPVLLAESPLNLPEAIAPNRARFGLPEDAFVVGMAFDPHSDPARKNPFASLEAFRQAFDGRSDCNLVVKMNSSEGVSTKMRVLIDSMKAIIGQDKRMHLIEETLPYSDLLSLYASYDVFISLHRSEGLGLGPLEAMRLGKPVVATAWSGNLSYMNYQNSCPVVHDFVDVDDESDFYGPSTLGVQGYWADPRPDHAAACLRRLFFDKEFREHIGRVAQRDARAYQARAERAGFADELQAIWESFGSMPQRDRATLRKRIVQALRKDHLRRMNWGHRQFASVCLPVKDFLDRQLLWRIKARATEV